MAAGCCSQLGRITADNGQGLELPGNQPATNTLMVPQALCDLKSNDKCRQLLGTACLVPLSPCRLVILSLCRPVALSSVCVKHLCGPKAGGPSRTHSNLYPSTGALETFQQADIMGQHARQTRADWPAAMGPFMGFMGGTCGAAKGGNSGKTRLKLCGRL